MLYTTRPILKKKKKKEEKKKRLTLRLSIMPDWKCLPATAQHISGHLSVVIIFIIKIKKILEKQENNTLDNKLREK